MGTHASTNTCSHSMHIHNTRTLPMHSTNKCACMHTCTHLHDTHIDTRVCLLMYMQIFILINCMRVYTLCCGLHIHSMCSYVSAPKSPRGHPATSAVTAPVHKEMQIILVLAHTWHRWASCEAGSLWGGLSPPSGHLMG